ncbi:hypothetical protein F5Y16DRAFT_401024 [Xylariaceae sp. FL0255]|nr:hypothetical protein F5Y16DRAFT_401024 [Xylariaceae sp. FL0255]
MKSEVVEPDPLDHPVYRTISPSLGKVQSVPQPRAPELVATPLPRLSQRAIIQSNNNNQIPVEIAKVAGRKWMLSTSLSLFAIGATLAAVSSSFAVLLTARTIQSVG